MNKFRKLGLIDYNGKEGGIEVHSSLLNLLLHEQPEIRMNLLPPEDCPDFRLTCKIGPGQLAKCFELETSTR